MTRVHLRPSTDNPDLANHTGTIEPEPVETAGVVYVVWDRGPRGWIREAEVEEVPTMEVVDA